VKLDELDITNIGRRREVRLIRQDEITECGLACLAMVANAYGKQVDLLSLRRRFSISLKGLTLRTLLGFAAELGFAARAVKADVEDLRQLPVPAILHWDFSHFVVLSAVGNGARGTRYKILDPALDATWMSAEEISRHFTGVAVELQPNIDFSQRPERAKLSLWRLWNKSRGLASGLVQTLLLSAVIQVFVLVSPLLLQISVDTIIPASDVDLLSSLIIGFLGLTILNLAASALRSLKLVSLGNQLGYQLVANLFRRMTRLPLGWFETRSVGEILTKFNATQPIVDLITHGLVSAVIDGIMGIITLALMAIYSPVLASISLVALIIYSVVRLSYFGWMRSRNIGVITAQAREQAVLIETIRGFTAIKMFAKERDRQRVWQNKRIDYVNAQVSVARIQALFDVANSAVMGIENIAFIYVAVRMVIDGHFSIGMMYAYSAYKQQFLSAGLNVVGKIFDYKMLDVQLRRIGDIALSDEEDTGSPDTEAGDAFEGAIELRNISFRYGAGDPLVLKDISMSIAPGETVAIVGPSGSGKTTLFKVAVGLLSPARGDVLVDGIPLAAMGLARFRRNVAAVMQDDTLYAGSVAENIAFFDSDIDMDRVYAAATAAVIHEEVAAMPMGYESLVGDMGSALSGGQKQRILLARALYHRPSILFMDEGTAHLDVELERAVARSLKALSITRVVIAHRPETIKLADRVVELTDGTLRERRRPVETIEVDPVRANLLEAFRLSPTVGMGRKEVT
jgi:ATP-binding cassette subfamily B protein RaxB